MRPAVCHIQPELLEQDNAAPHCHCDVQRPVQCWGWEVLVHPCYSPGLVHVIIGCLYVWDSHVQGKQFESEDCTNTAVTASLHHL